ncbi:hypothetical protein ACFL6O_06020, partial [candidate division KSB1 bacterium]
IMELRTKKCTPCSGGVPPLEGEKLKEFTYYLMSTFWLVNFPYRISMSLMTFIISGVISIVIAIGTVMYQSIKAALANPVKALRYE